MTVPLPDDSQVLLAPPDPAEAALLVRGFAAATAGPLGLTEVQRLLLEVSFTRRQPLGVVAAITPFNFPLNPHRQQDRSRARDWHSGIRRHTKHLTMEEELTQ